MVGRLSFKAIFIILITFVSHLVAENENILKLEELNALIGSIDTQTLDELSTLRNPFLPSTNLDDNESDVSFEFLNSLDENQTNKEQFVLQAIVGSKVKINDTWFNKNDIVNDLQIANVTNKFIVLKNKNGDIIIKDLKKDSKLILIRKSKD
ncbi:MAG: hypothetical protein HXX81_00245 [Campylobacterales bacterium]|nr:hypothetical protein [Campylobacterales bacterium]